MLKIKKIYKKILCIIVSFILAFTSIGFVSVVAYDEKNPISDTVIEEKPIIDEYLMKKLDEMKEDEKIKISVWCEDINYDEVDKKMYEEKNGQIIEKFISKIEFIYQSKYSPILLSNVTKNDIFDLEKTGIVYNISEFSNEGESDSDASIPTLRANYTRDTLDYSDSNVKV